MTLPNSILSSYNFARNSDFVFSEVVTKSQFYNLNLKNYTILEETNNYIFYKLNYISVSENDVIFCHTSLVGHLFKLLSKAKELKNIKLITSQSDIVITKKLFDCKSECISYWYSINVQHQNEFLIPIPLGIANDYSPKNLIASDFKATKFKKNSNTTLYLNFQKNTNIKERKSIYNYFSNQKWVEIDEPNLKLEEYKRKLQQHRFVLCPWGNGVDTHRIWETLYSGNIPITKYHHTFSNLYNLPILFINNYYDINSDTLEEFEQINDFHVKNEQLEIKYWLTKIRKNQIKTLNEFTYNEKFIRMYLYNLKFFVMKFMNSKLKKFLNIFKKLKNFLY